MTIIYGNQINMEGTMDVIKLEELRKLGEVRKLVSERLREN